jgi:hypothetical protein
MSGKYVLHNFLLIFYAPDQQIPAFTLTQDFTKEIGVQ